jgi:SPW repeat
LWTAVAGFLRASSESRRSVLDREAAAGVWEEWANFALGVWLVVSPWVLDFAGFPTILLMWNSVIFGALIFVVAGWALTEEPRRRRAAT